MKKNNQNNEVNPKQGIDGDVSARPTGHEPEGQGRNLMWKDRPQGLTPISVRVAHPL